VLLIVGVAAALTVAAHRHGYVDDVCLQETGGKAWEVVAPVVDSIGKAASSGCDVFRRKTGLHKIKYGRLDQHEDLMNAPDAEANENETCDSFFGDSDL
jgi:hypothetical protein